MPVLGQTPVRTHWEDSESISIEKIGSPYTDPNDSTKLVQDVKSHRIAQAEVRSSGSETIDATTLPFVILTDASPAVPIAVSLDSSVSDGFVCDVLNESTQTATFTPTSGDINDGTGAGSSQTLDAGTSCTLIKTSSGSPATANWKMLKGAGGGSSPLTTKGDLYTHDSSTDARLAVGSNGQALVADSTQTTGIKWKTLAESDITNLTTDLAAKAPTSRLINTTAPLTGGGDLSADRTLAISNFTGDSGSGGAKGAVPAPAAGDAAAGKFLKADGGWSVPSGGGVSSSRLISTTAPLTGGGDLTADRTLAVSAATSSNLGVVKPDGTTVTVDGSGVISAPGVSAALPLWDPMRLWAPPSSPNAMDDEFTGSSVSGSWTAVDSGSPVFSQDDTSWLKAVQPLHTGDFISARLKTLPTAPSQFDVRIWLAANLENFHYAGIMVRDSGSSKFTRIAVSMASGGASILTDNWTNLTTFSAPVGSAITNLPWYIVPLVLRFKDDGTNFSYYYSFDNRNFIQIGTSVGRTSFLASPNQVGIMVGVNTNANATTALFDYFRRTI